MSGLAERAQIYDETGSLEDLMLQLSMARGGVVIDRMYVAE